MIDPQPSSPLHDRVVHFLVHIPKCAGTTVERHFETHLGEGFLLAPRWNSVLRDVIGNRYSFDDCDPSLAPVRVVSGHSLSISLKRNFHGAEIRESVLIRDPVGYHLSFYNYRWTRHKKGLGAEPPDFARWYAAQRRNPISRFLLWRYFEQSFPAIYRLSSRARLSFLERRLADFWFVGDLSHTRELVRGVSHDVGAPEVVENRNVTKEMVLTPASLGENWSSRILSDNALDTQLYERWKDRGWRDGARRTPSVDEASDLSGWDQPRYLFGDIASGVVKKLAK